MAKPGDACGVVIPVTQEFLDHGDNVDQCVAASAADAFNRMCAEQGLTPTDQRLTWHGTVTEARLSGKGEYTEGLPDDASIYCFRATAI